MSKSPSASAPPRHRRRPPTPPPPRARDGGRGCADGRDQAALFGAPAADRQTCQRRHRRTRARSVRATPGAAGGRRAAACQRQRRAAQAHRAAACQRRRRAAEAHLHRRSIRPAKRGSYAPSAPPPLQPPAAPAMRAQGPAADKSREDAPLAGTFRHGEWTGRPSSAPSARTRGPLPAPSVKRDLERGRCVGSLWSRCCCCSRSRFTL